MYLPNVKLFIVYWKAIYSTIDGAIKCEWEIWLGGMIIVSLKQQYQYHHLVEINAINFKVSGALQLKHQI